MIPFIPQTTINPLIGRNNYSDLHYSSINVLDLNLGVLLPTALQHSFFILIVAKA